MRVPFRDLPSTNESCKSCPTAVPPLVYNLQFRLGCRMAGMGKVGIARSNIPTLHWHPLFFYAPPQRHTKLERGFVRWNSYIFRFLYRLRYCTSAVLFESDRFLPSLYICNTTLFALDALLLTRIVFLNEFVPGLVYLAVIVPYPPGRIGFLLQIGVVHPHEDITSDLTYSRMIFVVTTLSDDWIRRK